MSDNSSSEYLRSLLRADPATPNNVKPNFKNTDLSKFDSMLNTLNADLFPSSSEDKSKDYLHPNRTQSETLSQSSMASLTNRWKSSSGLDSDEQQSSTSSRGIAPADPDILDYTVIKFGADYVLRGKLGRYLSAVQTKPTTSAAQTLIGKAPIQQAYSLEISGQGIGEPLDCLNFINIENKLDSGPIKYGMTVAVMSPAAKERLLGLNKENTLGFWRHLVGQNEKFQILKAVTSSYSTNTAAAVGGSRGLEEPGSRGKFIRIGDVVLVKTEKSEQLLSLHEGINGVEARLVFKDRTGLGSELWQLEQFGAIPMPTWHHNRPYLNGKYLTVPPSMRAPSAEVEARTFPKSTTLLMRDNAPVPPPHLSSLTVSAQHLVLLRDLLLVLAGIEGQHIRVAAGSSSAESLRADERYDSARLSSFKQTHGVNSLRVSEITLMIDIDSADRSTVSQVMLLFPIAECAIRVREFVKVHSRYEYGFVSHALCAALKKILREFDILIAQLEHMLNEQKLSLQKLLYLLQPSKTTLVILDKLCKRLVNSVGGRMLDLLHGCLLEQGDAQARDLHLHLMQQASTPFLKMLSLWIFRGELQDPYKEFMVYEDTSVSKEALEEDFNAQYWETRYTLREEHIPRILRSHANKALTAGKYLHVVRGCMAGSTNSSSNRYNNNFDAVDTSKYTNHNSNLNGGGAWRLPAEKELSLSLEISDNALAQEIEAAYLFSSRALLKLLEVNHKLSTHVRSLRRFFLLEHGDFFIQFMDTAEEDLRKEVSEVVLSRLQSLLHQAVQTSTLSMDPNREDLTCSLAQHNLIQHLHLIQSAGDGTSSDAYANPTSQGLKGVEAFTLDYKVGWPLSIVLSRRAVTKYQLLSRLLYFSKHVERRVLTSWMGHQKTKELNVRMELSSSYCLRHRMLHFLQNFVYYMTLEVISPRSHELSESMRYAEDMDEVMELHEQFLDSCLNECLLASQELLKILTKLMTTCLMFADQMNKFALEEEKENANIKLQLQQQQQVQQKRPASVRQSLKRGDSNSQMRSSSSNILLEEVKLTLAHKVQHRQTRMRAQEEYIRQEASHDSFLRILNKFAETFDEQLKEFLDKLCTDGYRNHGQLSNLCVRLDYNGFYSSEFAKDKHTYDNGYA